MIFSRRRSSTAGRDSVPYGFEPEERPAIPVPEFGPYDIEVAPDDGLRRIDLGALHVPDLPGVSLQLEAAPTGQIVRVQLEHQGSRLQLSAFAAPRTEGIWDELRAQLRTSLLGNGAKVVEVDGEYGPQLAARMPGQGKGSGVVEVRHIGIDGPRWFVHAVLIGPAAVDPDQAGPLRQALRGLVVDRGSEARPVKEALPLRLPPEYAAQLARATPSADASTPDASTPDAATPEAVTPAPATADAGVPGSVTPGAVEPGPAKPDPAAPRATKRGSGSSARAPRKTAGRPAAARRGRGDGR